MFDPILLYLRSPIIYEILPPSGITIIIMYYIRVRIITVYSIFNDMRWNFSLFLSIIMLLILHILRLNYYTCATVYVVQ